MRVPPRSVRLLAALGLLTSPIPAAAQLEVGVSSSAIASSTDEIFEPYQIDEDYEEDFSDASNDPVHAEVLTCGLQPCAVPPPFVGEAEASAVTDFGRNDVDVRSESWRDGSNSSYHDSAEAGSYWEDELVFTSVQSIPSATIRARFRIEGDWRNRACFGFVGYFYDPATESQCTDFCCPCYGVGASASLENGSGGCEVLGPFPVGGLPNPFPDWGQEDGTVDTTVTLEFPLILDTPIRFGGALAGATGAFDSSSLVFGVEATVAALEVPAGVSVDSISNSEGAYNVPEPGDVAGAVGVLALAALRRRARRRLRRLPARSLRRKRSLEGDAQVSSFARCLRASSSTRRFIASMRASASSEARLPGCARRA
jgi:hypothetical protein